jgi:hypothetical protein
MKSRCTPVSPLQDEKLLLQKNVLCYNALHTTRCEDLDDRAQKRRDQAEHGRHFQ